MAAGDLSRRRYFPRQRGPEATGDYSDWDVAHVVSTRPNVTRGRPVFRGERSTPLQPSSTCRLALTASGITAPKARDYSTEGSGLQRPKAHGAAAGLTYAAWQISFRDERSLVACRTKLQTTLPSLRPLSSDSSEP
jgi:hypothetical protein